MIDRRKWSKTFNSRLDNCYDEMKWLYGELYHGNEEAFDYFISMLYRNFKERKASLKKSDHAREADPDWYKKGDITGMLLYTQCFGGTLKGVKDHLDYISDCGVN